ncbi:hypothetical protein BCF33_2322 [Hasllibacter halocynthiae]|uniref:Lipoprotein n=1 Tax=Hasllibacter halocynthiae TaxID=595589 RepID=A0A2T0X3L2_9RHOB|nr:hypothetical protein [Hasllibacter halocynthiae]PRY93454.1 hypothetical protein BCF33_2322 [Hasllibacter halocynthiae]
MARILALLALPFLAACAGSNDPDLTVPREMGLFQLGHNVVVAPGPQRGPFSRAVDEERFAAILREEMAQRFGRYEGGRLVHLGVSIEGYVVAAPGIPLVLSPKSILILNVTAWDDARGVKLNPEPEQIYVFESLGAGFLIGSGYTSSAEEQMQNLSENAAAAIQRWLLEHPGWLGMDPEAARAARSALPRRLTPGEVAAAQAEARARAPEGVAEAAAGAG